MYFTFNAIYMLGFIPDFADVPANFVVDYCRSVTADDEERSVRVRRLPLGMLVVGPKRKN